MPSQWSIVDNNVPNFDRTTRMTEFVPKLMNYMALLVESIKYQFDNLGAENFNKTALDSMKKDTTKEVEQEVTNMGGTLDATNLTVKQLTGKVAELEKENQQLKGRLQTMDDELGKALGDLDTIFTLVKANEDGSFTLGTEGKALALVGTVTVNGQEV